MSRRRRPEESEEEVHNGERWLLTYADMITLLLALFIVLFSISTINTKKFLAVAAGFQQAFNPHPSVLPSSNGVLSNTSATPTAGSQQEPGSSPATSTNSQSASGTVTPPKGSPGQLPLATIEAQIDRALDAKGLQADASATITEEGLVVQILGDHVFYANDVATLNATGDEVVDTIAAVLHGDTNDVDVEGYTDSAPIYGGPYTTNTQLSAERAVNVVVRLYKVDGITQSRLAAIGYGSTHPLVPNTTPANMAQNRRVDVVILAPGQPQP